MEPQLEGCGKRKPVQDVGLDDLMLQWSRNLRVAESGRRVGRRAPRRLASMEPQLEGCGKNRNFNMSGSMPFASMEPQLEGCGKNLDGATCGASATASMEPQLEGCGKWHLLAGPIQPRDASMEPQLEGCGKWSVWAYACTRASLQWSRNLRVAERTRPC